MTETIHGLKAALADARSYLDHVLELAESRQDEQVYGDGLQWNVRQVAVHIADADKGHNSQVMAFAEGREIIPPDFDIERYNKRTTEKRADVTFSEARTALSESRAALNAWLDTLQEADLDKVGRHASLRMLTIREVLKHMASHERQHADDIAAALHLKNLR
jgi:uncharacterized damage-inducible protein DinB